MYKPILAPERRVQRAAAIRGRLEDVSAALSELRSSLHTFDRRLASDFGTLALPVFSALTLVSEHLDDFVAADEHEEG